jgi:hypothetical protein
MRKRSGEELVKLLRELAEAMADRAHAGAPLTDAKLLRDLCMRLLDPRDPWEQLALAALARALDEDGIATRAGALHLANMLRELENPR